MKKLALIPLLLLIGCITPNMQVYFCAVDDCTSIVVNELLNAQASIHFMAYSFTDKSIADALIARSKHITVMGVIEKQRINQPYNKFNQLIAEGVNVVPDSNQGTMHHKVFIIDEKTVITGSFNPTKAGNEKNDENMLIIRDSEIAAQYLEEFSRVFG